VCLLLALLVAVPAAAQQPSPAPDVSTAAAVPGSPVSEDSQTMMDMLLMMDWSGWAFMILLFAFSLVATTVAIERLVNLREDKIIPRGFVRDLEDVLRRDEGASSLRAACDRWDSPIARILHSGLLRVGRPLPEVEKAMEDEAAHELSALRSRNRPLSVIASVSPLLGLLGTVFGMIIAFRTTSQAGLGKAELLAQGIYLALLTTAAGLSIAIPSLLAAAYFNSRVERFLRQIDRRLMDTLPTFARLERSAPAPHVSVRETELAGRT
jgi:biopolymer transport protein ExbB